MPQYKENGPAKGNHPWVSTRKHLKRVAERKHGVRTEWHGGILYVAGSGMEVPGVMHVPKPGRPVVGRAVALPVPATTSSARQRNGPDQDRHDSLPRRHTHGDGDETPTRNRDVRNRDSWRS